MTELYNKLLLVQNIPEIGGAQEVQNLIKSYAYRNDMIMEKAKQFSERFSEVLNQIKRIKISIEDVNNCEWVAGKYMDNVCLRTLLFKSVFCVCGDYKEIICIKFIDFINGVKHKYPKCKCK